MTLAVDASAANALAGGGELGERMRAIDWSTTPLGPVERWPQSLRTCVRIVLTSRQPMFVWWGDQLINLYNDAYIPNLGGKHPWALGRPASEVWREIWDDVGQSAVMALRGDEGTFEQAHLLMMERNGYREETYFTYSYSPVPGDDGAIGGVLCANNSDTQRVFAERQQALIREVAERATNARTIDDACRLTLQAFDTSRKDFPFALLYLIERDTARLAATCGIDRMHPAVMPEVTRGVPCPWPLDEVLATNELATKSIDVPGLPTGAWQEPTREMLGIPVRAADQSLVAVLVAARNPFRLLDADYRRFCDLLGIQIGNALANARSFAEERERAEALTELDRAKTAFFSNISHELRTPLTLILGPTEDALSSGTALAGEPLRSVHRNELRLLRLVNALLDFSRIEAGRMQARFAPTQLDRLTRELASSFSSAIEAAGLRFTVDCAPLAEPAYVDARLWETIVLNLISNALKFTFHGEIAVSLREHSDRVELRVRDTGVGIRAADVLHVFERFHRIETSRSRTHEGTGIGLALVQELARLHGGTVEVDSEQGRGSEFVVRIPRGRAHLLDEQIAPELVERSRVTRDAFVTEAERWQAQPPADQLASENGDVLLVDDNADMRDYLTTLLAPHWRVTTAANGVEALRLIASELPDVVVADVMMPELDGYGLLAALRRDPRTSDIPVILVSARAGEESRVEGLEAGADDYLVKPFSSRELIARVRTQYELSRARVAAEGASRAKDEFLAMLGHELRNPMAPISTAVELLRMRGVSGRELDVIERQVAHLVQLVDDLLDVSRIARGKVELRRDVIDAREVIARAVEIVTPLVEQLGHRISVEISDEDLHVDGDPVRLAQIVSNLLNNAAKYTSPGGSIRITARVVEDEVAIAIHDTGSGMDVALLPHVFEMFLQGARQSSQAQRGLGLGLAIVANLVKLHGGRVSASSEGLGRGSTFEVRLPRAPPCERRTEPAAPARAHACRVLVVDDNVDAAILVSSMLEQRGYEVRVAYDSAEALRAVERFVPEVAVLDLGLPVMDGYELCTRLRARPELGNTRCVALTGYGQPEDRERTRHAGFAEHLVKPVSFEQLLRAIDDQLNASAVAITAACSPT